MRNLTGRGGSAAMHRLPKGIAFEIADLVLVQSWSACTGVRMGIRLDHAAEDEEYDEVIELHMASGSTSGLIMWRNQTRVFVQPLLGRKQDFGSVAEALDSILPKQRAELSDILAPAWPAG